MSITDISGATPEQCIDWIAMLIDCSGDIGREDGIARALSWADAVATRNLTEQQASELEYFRGNAWAARQRAAYRGADSAWVWEQPESAHEILHFRRAIQLPGFQALPALRKCQILTNLGNRLNNLGRSVDAIAIWTKALSIDPHFGPALGNRGYGYMQYARCLYGDSYRGMTLYKAYQDLTVAVSADATYSAADRAGAIEFFRSQRASIETVLDVRRAQQIASHEHPLGVTREEQQYRKWALREQLFLNPLNDLGRLSIAAEDALLLPNIIQPIAAPPTLIGFFNQMKQEFASGRYLLYQGLSAGSGQGVHFSDRDVVLVNTLDYPSYSLAIEQTKAAFRIGYSILDKVAFLLNEYAALGHRHRDVYFRTVWYQNRDRNQGVHPRIKDTQNLPMRGLFWLAKDLYEPGMQDVMEPAAQEIYTIRNHLEHSYLKIHEFRQPPASDALHDHMFRDTLAFSVYRGDFEEKTLQVFRLARAALIYIAQAIFQEEQRRARERPEGTRTAAFSLPTVRDEWKQ